MRSLDRLRLAVGLVDLIEGPVEVERALAEETLEHRDALLEAGLAPGGGLERQPGGLVLALVPAAADADLQAPTG